MQSRAQAGAEELEFDEEEPAVSAGRLHFAKDKK